MFNLGPEGLQQGVLAPWAGGGPVRLGDLEWEPAQSEIKVLEGPELDSSDLAVGRGRSNAERSTRNVTAAMVSEALARRRAGAAVSIVAAAAGAEARAAVGAALSELGIEPTD